MKYGIVATYNSDGTQKYCSSARGGHISLSSDIDDIALFVQEASAVKALKQARKNGAERKNSYTLAVVGVSFTVTKTIDVPHPVAKAGYVIQRGNTAERSPSEYYTGAQKTDEAWIHSCWDEDAIERATVFKSDFDAQRIIALYIDAIEREIAKKEIELEETKTKVANKNSYWYKEPRYIEEEIERRQCMLEATRNAQVIAV